ncbi:MAG: molybdopterin-binding protein [Hyphomicrobiaceae bacterium]
MKFGSVPLVEAEGAILAHSIAISGGVLKKGTLLDAGDVARLTLAGIAQVTVARLESGDIGENAAAARVAAAICGERLHTAEAFTGRANVLADADGLAVIDAEGVAALNALDEGLTIATLAPLTRVATGTMVATVKIITFGLRENVVAQAEAIARARSAKILRVAAFRPLRVALVLTAVPGGKASVVAKRGRVTGERVAGLGGTVVMEETVPHATGAVADAIGRGRNAGADCILVFGASAIVDRGDVIPAGLVATGGEVVHLGMPVDPGNLLMLGRLDGVPVVGVPSCASSPKLNGFDWVLERVAAGLPVGRADIIAMAVGGLLMEIPSRPQPRQG